MTYEDLWKKQHPGEDFESVYTKICPSLFGYETVGSSCANPKDDDLPVICRACWQREMPCCNDNDNAVNVNHVNNVHYSIRFDLTDGRMLTVDYISCGASNASEVEEEIVDGDWYRVRTATTLVRVRISEVAIVEINCKEEEK